MCLPLNSMKLKKKLKKFVKMIRKDDKQSIIVVKISIVKTQVAKWKKLLFKSY